jgi:hypothetical protein
MIPLQKNITPTVHDCLQSYIFRMVRIMYDMNNGKIL